MMLRIKAFILLVLFSFSAIGNTFEVHYCKGEVMDITFVGQAQCVMHDTPEVAEKKHCHMNTPESCHQKKAGDNNYQKEDCCQTETITILNLSDVESEKQLSVQSAIVLSVFYPYLLGVDAQDQDASKYEYLEPDLRYDRQVFFQTFLI